MVEATEHVRRTAVVTGGNSGIGRATAHQLAARGYRVVIGARSAERGQAVVREIEAEGGVAEFVSTDVRGADDAQALLARAAEGGAPLTVLFNNAGYEGPVGPLERNTEEEIHRIVDTNLKGVAFCTRYALPHLSEDGCVVNNASMAGTVPFEPGALYAAAKAGVIHLTRSLAASYGEAGFRFYTVCPYITDAPMIDRVAADMGAPKEALAGMNPSGELARPEDVARVVVELVAGERELENGGAVLVDHGAAVTSVGSM